jgi:site-specific DNA-methyltransferase (adenine-specific)
VSDLPHCYRCGHQPCQCRDGVTIYHGDARVLLPAIDFTGISLTLTDPPWPGTNGDHNGSMWGEIVPLKLWQAVAPYCRSERLLLWLPSYSDPREWCAPVEKPFLRILCIRRAIPGYHGRVLQDLEVVYALGTWPPARKGRMVIPGGLAITYKKRDRINAHPAPRSLAAQKFLVHFWSDEGDIVLDPFAGSGTTGRACKDLGRRCIQIEIEERYCEIAARRLDQGVLFV